MSRWGFSSVEAVIVGTPFPLRWSSSLFFSVALVHRPSLQLAGSTRSDARKSRRSWRFGARATSTVRGQKHIRLIGKMVLVVVTSLELTVLGLGVAKERQEPAGWQQQRT